VALRWNGLKPRIAQERRMIRSVEQKLEL